jgi:NAD(P)H-nitrite reductase large subunit
MSRRYVLVGSSVAAVAAAEAILQAEPQAQVWMVGEEPYPFYSRPGLAYYLAGELRQDYLFPHLADRLQGVRRIRAQVTELDLAARQVVLDHAQRLDYDRLLLATGSTAVRLNVPGAELPGVLKLDTLQDASRMLAVGHGARRAVVVGGGITALEIVEGLQAHHIQVHYFLRGGRYWEAVLDEVESGIVERRLEQEGVVLHHFTEVTQVVAQRDHVAGVVTQRGEFVPCDMVAVAIGVRPRKELAERAGLAVERGVLVDEYLRTSAEDVFAAGDVAQVFDPLIGKNTLETLWWVARQQGAAAGRSMVGQAQAYRRAMPLNVTRLAGLTTTIIGQVGTGAGRGDWVEIVRGESETWQSVPDAIAAQDGFDVNRIRLMLGERTLLGAVVMGDQTLSRPLCVLAAQQVDLSPIRNQLLAVGANLSQILADFWRQLRIRDDASK